MRVLVAFVLAFVLTGGLACIGTAGRTKQRFEDKVAAWQEANPGKELDAKTHDGLQQEAINEIMVERANEKALALEKAAGSVSAFASGNIVTGTILGLGAILAYLGLKPKGKEIAVATGQAIAAKRGEVDVAVAVGELVGGAQLPPGGKV